MRLCAGPQKEERALTVSNKSTVYKIPTDFITPIKFDRQPIKDMSYSPLNKFYGGFYS